MTRSYSFDTSSLIRCWTEAYPLDLFPGFWDAFGEVVAQGRIHVVDEVSEELKPQAKECRDWLVASGIEFHPIDSDLQSLVDDIQQGNEAFARQGESKLFWADPWVIALAEVKGLAVVTEEAVQARKIPGICGLRGVPCINALTFIRDLGITFTAA